MGQMVPKMQKVPTRPDTEEHKPCVMSLRNGKPEKPGLLTLLIEKLWNGKQ